MPSKKNTNNPLPPDGFAAKLQNDFPEYTFRTGTKFAFRFPKTITLGPEEPFYKLLTLHELSHALLKHKDFKTDVERLKKENQAWDKAKELAKNYNIEVDEDFIQDQLDTYRNWLHQKSRCPSCGLTRFQDKEAVYHCPHCEMFCNQTK